MHKITPQVHKQIIDIASGLPAIQKYLNGKPLFRMLSKKLSWSELPEDEKAKHAMNDGRFIQNYQEAILVNHKVCLIAEYEMHGQSGINFYLNSIQTIIHRANENSTTHSNA